MSDTTHETDGIDEEFAAILEESRAASQKQEEKRGEFFERNGAFSQGGLAEEDRTVTNFADWYYYGEGRNVFYFHSKDSTMSQHTKDMMDGRIPTDQWPVVLNDYGAPMMSRGNLLRTPPSKEILSYANRRIHEVVCRPSKPKFYVENGENKYNVWKPIREPERPSQEVFDQVIPFIKELTEHMMGTDRAEWFFQMWAHSYVRIEEKANFCLVLSSSVHGLAKDILLSFMTYIHSCQEKVADIDMDTFLGKQFSEFMLKQIIILNEFYIAGQSQGPFNQKVKRIAAAPPFMNQVNLKYKAPVNVENVYRMIVTTNHGAKFQREPNDRRTAIVDIFTTKAEVEAIFKKHNMMNKVEKILRNGGGAAIYWWLVEEWEKNDWASKFDRTNLPRCLIDNDVRSTGRDVDEAVVSALGEVVETREVWAGRVKAEDVFTNSDDDPEFEYEDHWPLLVAREELYGTLAAGDLPERGKGKRESAALMDAMMARAGYMALPSPAKAGSQYIVNFNPEQTKKLGKSNFKTLRVYAREDELHNLRSTMKGDKSGDKSGDAWRKKLIELGRGHLRELRDFWMTSEGRKQWLSMNAGESGGKGGAGDGGF
ncbi:bifunctional DNA primase/polymerase [Aeromonas phage Gekk3-15]